MFDDRIQGRALEHVLARGGENIAGSNKRECSVALLLCATVCSGLQDSLARARGQ